METIPWSDVIIVEIWQPRERTLIILLLFNSIASFIPPLISTCVGFHATLSTENTKILPTLAVIAFTKEHLSNVSTVCV